MVWNGTNITWENLKEAVWKLGSANTLSRLSYKSLVCNHVLNIIQNIIWDTYIYVKPMYNIKFYIILKTYIHMQRPSCSTLTLTLTLILKT
jgi:FMN-dependent NADH-azoreductase